MERGRGEEWGKRWRGNKGRREEEEEIREEGREVMSSVATYMYYPLSFECQRKSTPNSTYSPRHHWSIY